MTIDEVNFVIDGCEVSLKNVDSSRLISVAKALEAKRTEGKKVHNKRSDRTGDNYQSDASAMPIPNRLDTNRAYNHAAVLMSKDTGGSLKPDSKQLGARRDILSVFIGNNNNPLLIEELADRMAFISNLSANAVRTYASYLLKAGVLSRNKVTKKMHISSWFINEVGR